MWTDSMSCTHPQSLRGWSITDSASLNQSLDWEREPGHKDRKCISCECSDWHGTGQDTEFCWQHMSRKARKHSSFIVLAAEFYTLPLKNWSQGHFSCFSKPKSWQETCGTEVALSRQRNYNIEKKNITRRKLFWIVQEHTHACGLSLDKGITRTNFYCIETPIVRVHPLLTKILYQRLSFRQVQHDSLLNLIVKLFPDKGISQRSSRIYSKRFSWWLQILSRRGEDINRLSLKPDCNGCIRTGGQDDETRMLAATGDMYNTSMGIESRLLWSIDKACTWELHMCGCPRTIPTHVPAASFESVISGIVQDFFPGGDRRFWISVQKLWGFKTTTFELSRDHCTWTLMLKLECSPVCPLCCHRRISIKQTCSKHLWREYLLLTDWVIIVSLHQTRRNEVVSALNQGGIT